MNNQPEIFEMMGPSTPTIARTSDRVSYGALWSIGLKGKF